MDVGCGMACLNGMKMNLCWAVVLATPVVAWAVFCVVDVALAFGEMTEQRQRMVVTGGFVVGASVAWVDLDVVSIAKVFVADVSIAKVVVADVLLLEKVVVVVGSQ